MRMRCLLSPGQVPAKRIKLFSEERNFERSDIAKNPVLFANREEKRKVSYSKTSF